MKNKYKRSSLNFAFSELRHYGGVFEWQKARISRAPSAERIICSRCFDFFAASLPQIFDSQGAPKQKRPRRGVFALVPPVGVTRFARSLSQNSVGVRARLKARALGWATRGFPAGNSVRTSERRQQTTEAGRKALPLSFGAASRGRTDTVSLPPDFERSPGRLKTRSLSHPEGA